MRLENKSVALRKESVDRNKGRSKAARWITWSLSARRAWIEILLGNPCTPLFDVALRKESVDRNLKFSLASLCGLVALRKESVDRNGMF